MRRRVVITSTALVLGTILAALWWWIDGNRMPEIEHPEPVPIPEPNAFDLLVEAAEGVPDQGAAVSEAVSGIIRDPETGEWRDSTIEDKRRVVESNYEALDLIRQALEHDFEYPDLDRGLVGGSVRHLGALRMLGRLLSVEIEVHLANERHDAAMTSVLDCIELGRRVGDAPLVLPALTGVAITGIGIQPVPEIIPYLNAHELRSAIRRVETHAKGPFDMAAIVAHQGRVDLVQLESALKHENWRLGLAKMDEREHWRDFDLLLTEYEDLPVLQRLKTRLRSWRYHKGRVVTANQQMITQVRDAVELPFPESTDHFPKPHSRIPAPMDEGETENFRKTWFRLLVETTIREMLLATLALEAWHRENGQYPERLEDLTSDLLQSIPRDPFTADAPLLYRQDEDGYVLYSIGPDGHDNGGEAMERPDEEDPIRRKRPRMDLPGDLVAGINLLRPPKE